jgi:hypothetical protein|tara:strand:- start:782 stop:1354 length:573 start_codon:yes stop_codon:yes gene_type:complete
MKVFIATLLLILGLQSLSKSDDISEFEIEGMSIGDSALKFFSEKDIKNNSKNYYRDKTFTPVQNDQYPFFEIYDAVDFNFRTGDKKYILQNINGVLFYDNNIEDCYPKMDSITEDIERNVKYLKKHIKDVFTHPNDKTGKSIFTQARFDLKDGYIHVICYDYSIEHGSQDHLSVSIDTKEFNHWVIGGIY